MSTWIDLSGALKLCDGEGRTVGVVLPNQAVEDLKAENVRLREETTRLEAAAKRLEQEKAEAVAERDMYLKSLHALTREDFTFTAEEIADLDKNGVPFDEAFIEELERDVSK